MTFSPRETQSLIERAWRRKAKGKPMRWRILRDLVACLSLDFLTTSQVQVAMRRLYALKNKTTRDMLEELQQENAVIQSHDKSVGYAWAATLSGADFWIQKTECIPAGIVEVVQIIKSVNALEV